MQQYLYKYLLLNQKLSIPALGSFVIEHQSAYFNEATGLLFPRRPVIEFYPAADAAPDKAFFDFLCMEMRVEEQIAISAFQAFSSKFSSDIAQHQFTDIPGIGKVKKEMNGHIIFLPASNLIDILPPLRFAEKVTPYKQPAIIKQQPVIAAEPKALEAEVAAVPEMTVVKADRIATEETIKKETLEIKKPVAVKPLHVVKESPPAPREPRTTRSFPELEELAAEVERIQKANELKAMKDKEVAGGVVVEMKAGFGDKLKQLKDAWWVYPAALAVVGLVALLLKIL